MFAELAKEAPVRRRTNCLHSCLVFGCLFALAGIHLCAGAQTTASDEWTWMGGSNTEPPHAGAGAFTGQPGVYGTLDTPAAVNTPGARTGQAGWKDSNGNLWLFGGTGYDSAGILGTLDDLWEFNPSNRKWAWMGGSSTVVCNTNGQTSCVTGSYGSLGIPATGNFPGLRSGEAIWNDTKGNVWLFSGSGYDSLGNPGLLNDLWKFNPSSNQWAWWGGSSTLTHGSSSPGVYGTLGTAAPGNIPGPRTSATTWTDTSGNLWLYGGNGVDSIGQTGYLDDLWEFYPSANMWSWMGGASVIPPLPVATWNSPQYATAGVYGTLFAPDPKNHPGGREGGIGWVDSNGNFWLYSGNGGDADGILGRLTDVWEFSPTTQEWAWMGGPNVLPFLPFDGHSSEIACPPPVFGTLGVHDMGNSPGCGEGIVADWIDGSNNLWLFGGGGNDAGGGGSFADLWEFVIPNQFNSYGQLEPLNLGWARMSGDDAPVGNWAGVYGTLGTPGAANIPGIRGGPTSWVDSSGDFWLFGGLGIDANGQQGYLNDLFVYQPAPLASAPSFSPDPGAYTFPQSVTVSDSTPGASIYYLDTGRIGAPYVAYNGPIALSSFEDIKAIAMASAYYTSPVVEVQYDLLSPPPTFSPAPGIYTSSQTVTINDSAPGITIYFTTDGSTPTEGSALYSGPVTVTATETLQAIASDPTGQLWDSTVASATYTIPPDFTVAINPASISLQAGQSGTATITVQDEGGFNGNVAFACLGMPAGDTCSFSTLTVPTPAGVSYSALTVNTTANAAAIHRKADPLFPESALAVALWFLGLKRRRWRMIVLLALSAAALCLFTGCGSSSTAVQPVTTTVTVTATSGALQETTTFTLTVN